MEFTANMKLNNVNLRAERHGEEEHGDTGCDISLTGSLPSGAMHNLWHGKATWEKLAPALWNENLELQAVGLGMIPNDTEFAACTVEFKPEFADDIAVTDAEVNQIKFKPVGGGHCEVKLRVQCHPTRGEIADLAGMLKREMAVKFVGKQKEMFD